MHPTIPTCPLCGAPIRDATAVHLVDAHPHEMAQRLRNGDDPLIASLPPYPWRAMLKLAGAL
jgi:hypothetical protein